MKPHPNVARAQLDAGLSEREWQNHAHFLLALFNWRLVYHTHRSERSPKGFPDCIAIRLDPPPARLFVAEWKREAGKTTPEQEAWLAGWRAVGVDARVWRPSQIEELTEVLR